MTLLHLIFVVSFVLLLWSVIVSWVTSEVSWLHHCRDNVMQHFRDEAFDIPEEFTEHRTFQQWRVDTEHGSVFRDGPDIFMPNRCAWKSGVLKCG